MGQGLPVHLKRQSFRSVPYPLGCSHFIPCCLPLPFFLLFPLSLLRWVVREQLGLKALYCLQDLTLKRDLIPVLALVSVLVWDLPDSAGRGFLP